jgi:hypothetical protein
LPYVQMQGFDVGPDERPNRKLTHHPNSLHQTRLASSRPTCYRHLRIMKTDAKTGSENTLQTKNSRAFLIYGAAIRNAAN